MRSVESHVFSDCTYLARLILSDNQIKGISADAFGKCPLLKRIDLSRNELEGLKSSLRLPSSLELLSMNGNRPEDLKWDEFQIDLLRLIAEANEVKVISDLENDIFEIFKHFVNKVPLIRLINPRSKN